LCIRPRLMDARFTMGKKTFPQSNVSSNLHLL
jgi:hypothetical protein